MQTGLTIYNLPFLCTPLKEADFNDFAAIYVVLCVVDGKTKVLDVGQSGEVGTRINNHTRMECWKKNCPTGNIWVCIYKTPTIVITKDERLRLETKIRNYYNPTCGDQ